MLMRAIERIRARPAAQAASAGVSPAFQAGPEDEIGDAATAERAFARLVGHMRTLGFGLGALPVAAVLYESRAPAVAWVLMVVSGYAWPQLAGWLSRRSATPRLAEFRNMRLDSMLGGAWIAAIGFSLVPSALLLTMLTMDKVGVAGWRFLLPNLALLLMSCLAAWALLGFPFDPATSTLVAAASLPLLFAFPVAMSHVLYRMTRKVIRQNRQLALLNRSDMLTGLPNRRHWQEAINHEIGRYFRTGRPAVVMLIDVDHFKEVNDRHGHDAGDDVLRTIAGVLRASIRDMDTAVRYGGDEFAVLAAETGAGRARDMAERIRSTFLAARGSAAADVDCTLSIGLAQIDDSISTGDAWMKRADAAMYGAKTGGRNRVVVDAASSGETA